MVLSLMRGVFISKDIRLHDGKAILAECRVPAGNSNIEVYSQTLFAPLRETSSRHHVLFGASTGEQANSVSLELRK